MHDVAGATVVTKDRVSAKVETKRIQRKYRNDPKEYDDFYRRPASGGYRAFHVGLLGIEDRRLEVQVKSKPMDNLAIEMHEAYKKDKDLSKFVKEGNLLSKLGF